VALRAQFGLSGPTSCVRLNTPVWLLSACRPFIVSRRTQVWTLGVELQEEVATKHELEVWP
jgi:hypothetical protein